MKKSFHEFVAVRSQDGAYECQELPTIYYAEPLVQTDRSVFEKVAQTNNPAPDINKTFFESYQSNFMLNNNDLLKNAQKNLMEMQEILLASLKGI